LKIVPSGLRVKVCRSELLVEQESTTKLVVVGSYVTHELEFKRLNVPVLVLGSEKVQRKE
jgi:hypothetical protein